MKPTINLDELEPVDDPCPGDFEQRFADIASKVGAQKLGYRLTVVPPGKKACPFHNHRVNEEMFLILAGEGRLRFGDKEYPLKKHDIVACPPGGREVAHQILNTGKTDLRYLALSTMEPVEVCEYPDSNKLMVGVGTHWETMDLRHVARAHESVGYYEGET